MESFFHIIERFKTKMAIIMMATGAAFSILILLANYKSQIDMTHPLAISLMLSSIFLAIGAFATYKAGDRIQVRNTWVLLVPPVIWINSLFTTHPDISGGYIYIPAIIVMVTFIAGFWRGLLCLMSNILFLYLVAAQVVIEYEPHWQSFDSVLFIDRAIAFSITFTLSALINRFFHQAIDAIHYLEEQQHHRQRLSSLAGLVGGLAHEFNNPLQIIEWCLQALSKENPDATSQKWLQKALHSAERIEDITHSLLFFTESSARMLRFNKAQNVWDAWQDASSKLIRHIKHQDINLSCQLSKQHYFYGQRFHLSTILHAILQNAIDALASMPATHHGQIRITESITNDGKSIEIHIQDNGPGIPKNLANKVFEPFFSTKEQHTGLGLSSCYAICQAMQWQLSFFTPTSGHGCQFTLTLPIARNKATAPSVAKAS